ncbi:oxidoreductase domain protein [Paenibacillus curdlanolyticus YK9]|uniref:Oxidoreductase domain protein n=1 Tax=Paenibacillus curdlanolyticus YK9 TaxID=717606 RepID=E0I5S8_9BACL|nr:Gfo/Idh/MocA family oxidoreductase [Paenibacillus curdlanolyticus]EFM12320.1 oxidoreductase domain protein [Paenibacillus curdlanolyticus YK9]
MKTVKKRIGVIGLGDIASKAYLPVLGTHPEVELIGVMSRTKSKVDAIADQYRVEGRFTALEALLDLKPDGLFVHSATEAHEQIVTACLERDIAVYVDKPLAYEIAASERMTELAAKRGVLLAVGFNRRFAPRYQEIKQWVERSGGFDLMLLQKHRTSVQQLPAAHTLYDDLIHMLDLMLWLGASPYELTSYVQQNDHEGRLQHATGSITYGSGSSDRGPQQAAIFSMNRSAGADLERVELHGNGCSVEIVNMESATWQHGVYDSKAFGSWDSVAKRRGFAGIIQHFLDSIDNPAQCKVKAEDVLDTHRLVERLIARSK